MLRLALPFLLDVPGILDMRRSSLLSCPRVVRRSHPDVILQEVLLVDRFRTCVARRVDSATLLLLPIMLVISLLRLCLLLLALGIVVVYLAVGLVEDVVVHPAA